MSDTSRLEQLETMVAYQEQAIEVLSSKLGLLLLSLGGMHFANLYVFHRIRRRAKIAVLPPPVAPQMHVLTNGAARFPNAHAAEEAHV